MLLSNLLWSLEKADKYQLIEEFGTIKFGEPRGQIIFIVHKTGK